MNYLVKTLGCGNAYSRSNRGIVELTMSIFEDIYTKIIPLFNKYKIEGVKYLDFEDFKKAAAAELINSKAHLTLKGLEEIRKIKLGMNGRY